MKDSVAVEKGAGKAKKSHQREQILPHKKLFLSFQFEYFHTESKLEKCSF